MKKIILLLLLNILIYYIYKSNIYVLSSIFLFMIYYLLKLRYNIKNNIIEGMNDKNMRNEFIELLDDNIVNNREIHNYFDIVLDKLDIFLKKYITRENIPIDQPCIGIFDSWSNCSVDCGTGSQYRTFHVMQDAGEGGIKCIYNDGEIDKKTCFQGLCDVNASCVEDSDCSTGYCNPYTNLCDYKDKCAIYALYNCNADECDALGENYHIDSNGNCIDYSQRSKSYSPEEDIYSFVPINNSLPDEKLGTTTTNV